MPLPIIQGVLFEPVGCLADFRSDEFEAMAGLLCARLSPAAVSASELYWKVLDALENASVEPPRAELEHLELDAVDRAFVYDDAAPALTELRALGVTLVAVSSLSAAALARFVEKASFGGLFDAQWSRDSAGGVKSVPIGRAVAVRSLNPESVLYLSDSAEGIHAARRAGVQPILMMNDPDEAMKLTALKPAGGIVSLHELPDFVRLVAAEHAMRRS